MTTHWMCTGIPPRIPPCGASGTYEHKAQTGDSGDAYKHQKETGHSTISAAGEWVLGVAA